MKHLSGLVALGVSIVFLAPACGSEDDKKKSPPSKYDGSGGEGGDGSNAGGSSNSADAGEPGSANTSGSGGTPSTTDGGSASMFGDGGTSSSVGGNGVGDLDEPGDGCEPGMGECDGKPETVCEQDLTLITACGDCDTQCKATNGVPSCEDGACVFACNDGYADCDGEGDNGCEVALATDAANCGACGRDCAMYGATCGSQVCSTVALQSDISTDGSGAWAFSPLGVLHAGLANYSIRRLMLDSPNVLSIWAPTNETSPTQSLLVVDNDVYWAERGNPGTKFSSVVYRKSITAAAGVLPTPVFSPEYAATYLKRQGNALYWASGGYQEGCLDGFIYTRALDAEESDAGTAIVTSDQGVHGLIRQFGVTSNALYWVTEQNTGTQYELRTAPLSGSPISVVPAVLANASLAVSVFNFRSSVYLVSQGQYIYFNRVTGDAHDGIYRYKTGLAKPERLVLASYPLSLAVDDEYVYFTQYNVQAVWRAPINGGAGGAAEKIATDNYFSKVLAVDDTYVYADVGDGSATTDVFKIIK